MQRINCSLEGQKRLRELRLWHWKQVLIWRDLAKYASSRHFADSYNKAADEHIKFVQTLNDFFDVGDTAEKDNDTNKNNR
jgi:hypothetical protein